VPALRALLADADPNYRARALWLLDRIGGDARESVLAALDAPDPVFRALAVRILRRHGAAFSRAILDSADDASDLVRREVLLALRNLEGEEADAALARIAATYDGTDRYQLEAIHIAAADRKESLLARLEQRGPLADEQFPLLLVLAPKRAAQQVVERLKSAELDDRAAAALIDSAATIASPAAGWGLLALAADSGRPAELRARALEKVTAGAEGRGPWASMSREPLFAETLGRLLEDEALRDQTLAAIDTLRVRKLGDDLLAAAEYTLAPAPQRANVIRVAVNLKPKNVVPVLRKLLDDPQAEVAAAALWGLVDLQDLHSLREVLARDAVPLKMRRAAVERAVDSTAGAILLLRLIDEDKLSAELRDAVVAKATEHPDANIRVLYEKFVPDDQRPQKLGAAISADEILALEGDANRGRLIFFKSSAAACQQCHAVHGFGGATGPELTAIGKKYERGALLETILEPSKAIAPEYIPYLLETKGGQVHAGFLAERTAEAVVLRDVENKTIRVAADDIEALLPQQKSLMPELILSQVTAQDAADLLAFLTTLK
jgi:putative heme-binding domain-containing protein